MKIRVHSKQEGFRRAGLTFGRQPVTLDTDVLGAAIMAHLEAEPMLVVERLQEAEPEPKGKGKEDK